MAADFARAKQTASDLIEQYNIERPPVDPEFISENLGVKVLYVNFPKEFEEKISGYFDPSRETDIGRGVIIINRDISVPRKIFTIAHELGHFMLHSEIRNSQEINSIQFRTNSWDCGSKPDIEQEADVFAANLLMPERFVKKYSRILDDNDMLANLFCVSKISMFYRLKDLNLL